MILDVGCGNCKRGDVGVDMQRSSSADVICDAHHLPFQDGSFETVFSHHALEHLADPELALREWCRVAKNHVRLYLPWRNACLRLPFTAPKGKSLNPLMQHRWSFTKTWFLKFARKYGLNMFARYSDCFVFPAELEVYVWKKNQVIDSNATR